MFMIKYAYFNHDYAKGQSNSFQKAEGKTKVFQDVPNHGKPHQSLTELLNKSL